MKQLQNRWTEEWAAESQQITQALQNGKGLAGAKLSKTDEDLLDLRGYATPKTVSQKIPKGRVKPVVLESLTIRKLKLANADLSHSDFESCVFHECHFENCCFDNARLRDGRFYGCTFTDMRFRKTDIGAAYFSSGGGFFSSRKDNFINTKFELCNFSGTYLLSQGFINCSFINCKTGMLMINDCHLKEVAFSGTMQDLFFISNKASKVDLQEAFLSGVSFQKQNLDNFLLPQGDSYYHFRNKEKEVSWLESQSLDAEETSMLKVLQFVWKETDSYFIDINYLSLDEQVIAKKILQRLRDRQEL